jgi:hypothetical protein
VDVPDVAALALSDYRLQSRASGYKRAESDAYPGCVSRITNKLHIRFPTFHRLFQQDNTGSGERQ